MRDRFVGFAFAAAELLVETDEAGTIHFATGAFKRWFAVSANELIGRSLESLLSPADRATVGLCLSLAATKGRVAPASVHLANAEATPMALAGLCRPDASHAICFTLGRLPASNDPENELLSSEWLAEATQRQITEGTTGAVGLIEVAGLAPVAAGAAGERQRQVRVQISSTLVRVAGPDAQAQQLADGRYGLLSKGALDVNGVVGRLQEYLNAIPEAARARVRGSGISLASNGGLTKQQASAAMRYALGRFAAGGVDEVQRAGFAAGLIGFMNHANARTSSARAAIAKRRFKIRFQPIVSFATGEVHHYEALLRPIPTDHNPSEDTQEFVSFVEAVGLAEELDLAVMSQVLEIMRAAPWASVAINISGVSAQSPGFREKSVPMIREAVDKYHLQVLIELTETAEICSVKEAATTVSELRAAGAAMCLDDFGSGAASYRYLRDFRVDFVKIDGSFIRRAETDAKTHGMIISIVELANFVGAKVIAEMVETVEQAKLMREAGIEFGQGWLFGKPGYLPGTAE